MNIDTAYSDVTVLRLPEACTVAKVPGDGATQNLFFIHWREKRSSFEDILVLAPLNGKIWDTSL